MLDHLIKKAKSYDFHSFQYDMPSNPILIKDYKNTILIGEENGNRVKCFWGTNKVEHLVEVSNQVNSEIECKELLLEFIPEEFVETLQKSGFQIISEWIDFWVKDISKVNLESPIVCDIRKIKKDEIEIVSKITQSCTGISREFYGEDVATIQKWWLDDDIEMFVALKKQQIVGVCVMAVYDSNKGKVAWVRELAVRPEHQHQRIGQSLLITGLKWGMNQGATLSFLATDKHNHHAINLYTRLGFENNGERGQINMTKSF
ncbi:GNAT family N-acetyltransferase [Haloplasma contractile]|uniref:Acetyltransferase GNAT family protein n=1 Tax=Haloplasma contractile SSD-17B TaxID=1033810 RepID=F7PVV2_9MOLU|nr:GNAT family N-acetyltransferase [Haloplasma contractile]ERJ12728.1 Acetyltransferase GNAT family protein [Haloplasma contractile SSD-17B]